MYPILEFDPTRKALIEPAAQRDPQDVPEYCVACFFRDVIDLVMREHNGKVCLTRRWEDGPHDLYEIPFQGRRLGIFHPGIGSALAAALMEENIAYGCRKFIACGGSGVLNPDMALGHLTIISAAVRDEGASYHYLPPSREVVAQPEPIAALEATMQAHGVPYIVSKAWTTDAPYRETPNKIAARRSEGCAVVEMEAAGMMAVAQFRGVAFGQVVYGGDDLSGPEWDNRGWQSRSDIRQNLFWLAAEAVMRL
jgi:uridine phosphorylase